MPPKKNAASKKTQEKVKQKIVEVWIKLILFNNFLLSKPVVLNI